MGQLQALGEVHISIDGGAMSTNYSHYRSGDIFGIIYQFDKAGDGIAMHKHGREALHNTVVLRGSILFYGPGGERKRRLVAGEILDFDGTLSHEIVALEPDTKIINTFLHGIPAEYVDLPMSERFGSIDVRLAHDFRE